MNTPMISGLLLRILFSISTYPSVSIFTPILKLEDEIDFSKLESRRKKGREYLEQ